MADLEIKIEPVEFQKTKDYHKLKEACVQYMEFMASEDYHEDNDWDNWIYEAAMKFVYGPKVWEEVRRLRREQEKVRMEERHKQEIDKLKRLQEDQRERFGDV